MILTPTSENILLAAEALRAGKLVGMPTETVYGVAADALNVDAVRATFAAKGRPSDNPLIVHLPDLDAVDSVALEVPEAGLALAAEFWPGPLTLVLPKRPHLPDEVTAGLDSVAVRVPSHPVTKALLVAFGGPVTAPSANPFMGLSATRATDIDPDLVAKLALVLDGGAGDVGLESTVVDVRGPIRLLRPGGVTREQIEAVLGEVIQVGAGSERRSPGLYRRHYAPKAGLRLVDRLSEEDWGLTFEMPMHPGQLQMPSEPAEYGARLYAALHDLDRRSPAEILVQAPPTHPAWSAVWDRLRKAAEPL